MPAKKAAQAEQKKPMTAAQLGAVAACIALLCCLVRWVPFGAAAFAGLLVAGRPKPPPTDPAEKEEYELTVPPVPSLRRLMLPFGGCGGMWRMTVASRGEDRHNPLSMTPGGPRLRGPWTHAALMSVAAAAAAVGIETALSTLAGALPLEPHPSLGPVGSAADPTDKKIWLAPVSGLLAWRAVRAAMWKKHVEQSERVDPQARLNDGNPWFTPPEPVCEPASQEPGGAAAVPALLAGWKTRLLAAAAALAGVAPGAALHVWVLPLTLPEVVAVSAGLAVAAAAAVLALSIRPSLAEAAAVQREPWEEFVFEVSEWDTRWGFLGGSVSRNKPTLLETAVIPDDGVPMLREYLFQYGATSEFDDLSGMASSLRSATGSDLCLIQPRNPDTSAAVTNWAVFTVTVPHPEAPPVVEPHMSRAVPASVLYVYAAGLVCRAFDELKLPTPMVKNARIITEFNSDAIIEAKMVLLGKLTPAVLMSKVNDLAEKMSCGWVRVAGPKDGQGRDVRLYFASAPLALMQQPIRWSPPDRGQPSRELTVASAEWSHTMRACGLTGAEKAVPLLKSVSDAEGVGLEDLVFDLPPGLSSQDVRKANADLAESSSLGYVHSRKGPQSGEVTLTVGAKDPLSSQFRWADYADEVLHPPVLGHPRPDWVIGVGPNGKPIWSKWSSSPPHLLIAGTSGGGKSVLVNSMICQMLHNNHPADLQLWLADPKNELQIFRDCIHVRRFVDVDASEDSLVASVSMLLHEATEEMERREAAFRHHHRHPKQLSEAREIAKAGDPDDAHINFPYLIIVVEECRDIFNKAYWGTDKEKGARGVAAAEQIAARARSAGIYLCVITQYPTKDNLPVSVKTNLRRLGLRTKDQMSSMVIMDGPGLEDIVEKGRGMLGDDTGDPTPFRGFLIETDEIHDLLDDVERSEPLEYPKLSPGCSPTLRDVDRFGVPSLLTGPSIPDYVIPDRPPAEAKPVKPVPVDLPEWMTPAAVSG